MATDDQIVRFEINNFEEWLKETHGLTLALSQREACKIILAGLLVCGPGRASGKTFLLTMIDEFLRDDD